MSNPIDRLDGGIVFYAVGVGVTPPTYVDINGQTQTAIVLSGSAQQMPPGVASAYFHVGAEARFTLQVDVVSTAGTEIDLGLVGHFDADPTAPMGALATFRNDNQKLLAVHPFTTSGRYILQTANLGAVVEGAIQALGVAGGEGIVGSVVVRLRVER